MLTVICVHRYERAAVAVLAVGVIECFCNKIPFYYFS